MKLDWIPEQYSPAGGLAAAGFYKLLGRPRLDPLTVLVRETAQNSWDARDPGEEQVDFSIEGWELIGSEVQALRDRVFTEASRVSGVDVGGVLSRDLVHGLFVADRRTLGLGGPLRADDVDPEDSYDWVDFVLNVGKANTQGHTGGTYGFGKTISYIVSEVNTVVIHSRTLVRGTPQTRLIACAIGEEFKLGQKLHTGRHWWGCSRDGFPEPITGREADQLADAIGMPPFDDDLGTNLLILQPDFGGRNPEQAMQFIAESVTWHLWPKLVGVGDGPTMNINVSWNGEYLDIPDPSERPPLQGFQQAFEALHRGWADEAVGEQLDRIRCGRPRTEVGDLATVAYVRRPRATVDDGHDPSDPDTPPPAALIGDASHHVALLRTPELVVDYLEGPALPEGELEWAGVFRCADEHDGRFAQAEPPTHDSWRPELLPKGPDRTIVNVGIKRVREVVDRRWGNVPTAATGNVMGTSRIADELAHLVGTVAAEGRGTPDRPPRQGTARTVNPKVAFVSAEPEAGDGVAVTRARFAVTPAKRSRETKIWVRVGTALDGNSSDPSLDPDLKLVSATWDSGSQQLSGQVDAVTIQSTGVIDLRITVERGRGTSVMFDVTAEKVDGS